jgi:hypothetical protein
MGKQLMRVAIIAINIGGQSVLLGIFKKYCSAKEMSKPMYK